MNAKTLKILEYKKITDKLANYAISPSGRDMALALLPSTDVTTIRLAQKHTAEAVSLSLKQGRLSLRGFHDIRPALKRLPIGSILSMKELLDIADFLMAVEKAIAYFKDLEELGETLAMAEFFHQLQSLRNLEREIHRCIISEEEMADDASPKLADIRRSIKSNQASVKGELNKLLQSTTVQGYLQDNIITIRNNRYCLPVRSEYRNEMPGMIHDQSSSGSTLFVEPMAVINLNNKLNQLLLEEEEEIERILSALSAAAALDYDALTANLEALTHLDFIFAKGELALLMDAGQPNFNEDGIIYLKNARHPLLPAESVVASTIYLGEHFTTLVITGPNTGGKTVSLKTLGLLSLMGQAGLHIPAADGSQLTVLENIYADIGDEQSIEQSLSTFSSHMVNIVEILKSADYRSLVLFDELGAGTDPVEGAALAMAILDHLKSRGVLTAATTHYSELKVYALSTDGVENASCEFDVNTLKPTYRLLIGIPGKSNAFAISKRLGLSAEIIASAQEFISGREVRFEDLITDLEMNRKTVLLEKERAEKLHAEVAELNEELRQQKEKLHSQKTEILKQAKQEAYRILDNAKTEADQIIRKMNKIAKSGDAVKELETERGHLRDKMNAALSAAEAEKEKSKRQTKIDLKSLKVGQSYLVNSFGQVGTLLTLPDSGRKVTVQLGIMTATVDVAELRIAAQTQAPVQAKLKSSYKGSHTAKSMTVSREIDLRGYNGLDGIEAVDKYIDDVFLSSLNELHIIHGKGTGALRSQLHQFLKNDQRVKSYRLGEINEGGAGVTVVTLRK
ncbi:endonuclease MutS2 [Clostridiales bacterium COT073_COT-073]|nr:endonuclease MutS2 [Clostridiales bacterium COT073_COT-073]